MFRSLALVLVLLAACAGPRTPRADGGAPVGSSATARLLGPHEGWDRCRLEVEEAWAGSGMTVHLSRCGVGAVQSFRFTRFHREPTLLVTRFAVNDRAAAHRLLSLAVALDVGGVATTGPSFPSMVPLPPRIVLEGPMGERVAIAADDVAASDRPRVDRFRDAVRAFARAQSLDDDGEQAGALDPLWRPWPHVTLRSEGGRERAVPEALWPRLRVEVPPPEPGVLSFGELELTSSGVAGVPRRLTLFGRRLCHGGRDVQDPGGLVDLLLSLAPR